MLGEKQCVQIGGKNITNWDERGIEIGWKNIINLDEQKIGCKEKLRFWEVDHLFKCPVVGMCLTLSEQKQLLKRVGLSCKKKSTFEIHEILVASSERENRLAIRADSMLNRKFGKEIAPLLKLKRGEFMTHCKAAFDSGDCVGVLWAIAVTPGLPDEFKKEIFGKIHMGMHWNGEQRIKLKQTLARQQNELSDMRQEVKSAVRSRHLLQEANKDLKESQEALKGRLTSVEKERDLVKEKFAELNNEFPAAEFEQTNLILKKKLDALHGRCRENERQLALLKGKNMELLTELEQQRELNENFKKESQEIIGEVLAVNRCDASCPSFDLCKKRVLIVGGITRMESLYRELIEGSGGIFEYHDGFMKQGIKRLESRLRRADVVLCPVNCNSHAACSIVKTLAKKHNKTVHMMANSSLNSVSRVIWEANNDRGIVSN